MDRTLRHRASWLTLSAVLLAPVAGTAPPAGAAAPTLHRSEIPPGNYDIRVGGRQALAELARAHGAAPIAAMARAAAAQLASRRAAAARLADSAGAEIELSHPLGSAEVVRTPRGALTAPAPGRRPEEVALGFLRSQREIYGLTARQVDDLEVLGVSRSPSGLEMVRLAQKVGGLPVFQSETRAIVDREGRLIRTTGLLVPGIDEALIPQGARLSPEEALAAALASVGIEVEASRVRRRGGAPDGLPVLLELDDDASGRAVASELVYFPLAPGVLVPAWSQIIFTRGPGDWFTVVDAETGTLLWRKDIRAHLEDARFSVYVQADGETPADSPAPASPNAFTPGSGTQPPAIGRGIVGMLSAYDPAASPGGWIPDGGDTTTGNNVDAYLDRNGDDRPDAGALDRDGRPRGNPDPAGNHRDFLSGSGAPRSFAFTPAPAGADPDAGDDPSTPAYQRGAVSDLFYLANWYHDRLFALGFDEAAGNFQVANISGMGAGGDPVLAEAQQGADAGRFNEASFSTPPDGTPGLMRLLLFPGPDPDRDPSLDAEIVFHELTHGLTERLVGNGAGLSWAPGQALGEGWSDFYALALLDAGGADDPQGQYAVAAYSAYRLRGPGAPGPSTDNYVYGIRRFPYTTDHAINPLTWADVDDTTADMAGGIPPNPQDREGAGALEVHNAGELWALSLWEVRNRIIAAHGGDVPAGNAATLQIVTDALKMTPANPSFVEGRDALVDADCAANACAHESAIWEGFAARGLGYRAVAPLGEAGGLLAGIAGHLGIGESFSTPYLEVAGATVDDGAGDGDGAIEPGESISLAVELFNPWRATGRGVASARATLATTTPAVALLDAEARYGPIPAQGTATGEPFRFTVDRSAACGQSLDFQLTTDAFPGTATFTLRVGRRAGTAAPVAFTSRPRLRIPDASLLGATDTLIVSENLEVGDLNFRLDDLTHGHVGQLTVMLRAPDGYGTDLIWFTGAGGDGGALNAGNDFLGTVIDDESGNDLLATDDPAAAPFTGDWLPAFNSPSLAGIDGEPVAPDPAGQLGWVDGSGTRGRWSVHVVDPIRFVRGALNAWSLLVTPTRFACEDGPPFERCVGSAATLCLLDHPLRDAFAFSPP
jgi:subtilisin-like proprotein convertase family protein